VLFNSYVFILAFLPLTLLAWWTIRGHRARLVALTLASYLFYGWWDYRFIPLMVLSTTADYLAGLRIHRSESSRARKTWLVALLVFNLGILAIFKYYGFFIDSLR
jgi:alginate O-acetyltransferase complex protein AlgI